MANGTLTKITAPDGATYDTYIAGKQGTALPAVIVFTPIFGVDEDMTVLADEWASRGFIVAVPDYFFRITPGPLGRDEENRKKAFARWEKLDAAQAIEDMRPLVARLASSPCSNGKLGALGYCAGGELAFLAATRLGAGAIAAFHGCRIDRHLAEAGKTDAKISLHFGDSDPLVPMDEVGRIKAALEKNPKVGIHIYSGANHGFSFKGRPSYHEVAANESQKHSVEVLSVLKA